MKKQKTKKKMNALKVLLNRQRELGETIDGAEKKFAKTGTAVRKEKYFRKRMTEMHLWWAEFCDNISVIMTAQEECTEKRAYLARNYYDEIKARKEKITELYLDAARKMYPAAEFQETEKESASNELGSDDDDDDDAEDFNKESGKDVSRAHSVMDTTNTARIVEAVRQIQKKKTIEKLLDVRSASLRDAIKKLVLKHDNPTSEVEIEFDVRKLENLLAMYTTAYEDRIMITIDDFETDALGVENEDLTNIAERTILSLRMKQAEYQRQRNTQPEAPELQPLRVPKFDGRCQNWVPFMNLFRKVIHDNDKMDNIQRMQYLFDCLESEPKRIIQHLSLTDKDYETAFEMLEKRYNDERKIITRHLDAFLDHGDIADDVEGLKSLVDGINESLHAIRNLRISEEQLGEILLVRIIEKKLDVRTRRSFESTLPEKRKIPKLEILLKFLENRFIGMESI